VPRADGSNRSRPLEEAADKYLGHMDHTMLLFDAVPPSIRYCSPYYWFLTTVANTQFHAPPYNVPSAPGSVVPLGYVANVAAIVCYNTAKVCPFRV
jgi:hypothetical protein